MVFFFFSSTCVGFCFPCFFVHHPIPLLSQSKSSCRWWKKLKAPREEGADFRIDGLCEGCLCPKQIVFKKKSRGQRGENELCYFWCIFFWLSYQFWFCWNGHFFSSFLHYRSKMRAQSIFFVHFCLSFLSLNCASITTLNLQIVT